MYPNNPHINFWKNIGFGELTRIGKEESMQLGKTLRNRYQFFLSEDYNSEEVMTKSTDYNRTRQTASLVLDGLFVSTKTNNKSYIINYKEHPTDFVLRGVFLYCKSFRNEVKRLQNTIEYQNLESQYKHIFDLITKKTTRKYSSILDAFFLFQVFYSEKYMNLTLPVWAEQVYETLHKLAVLECYIENYTTKLKRLNGGRMLKTVLKNMKKKSKNALIPHNRKMFLYSAHDVNVINILATMNVFTPHFPNYNAATLIELHHNVTLGKHYVKVFYISRFNAEPTELIINECGNPCELNNLEEIMYQYLPVNYTQECEADVPIDDVD
ncbi:hypothetical protein RN001_004554 [Aquatica leii]|uniref:acid phosphatase n=1 Tax=Aquatica leii TaxID=1421715 RepID=A0AAN7SRR8_9COLE|nr:hypothetical protein RN001_004554 [Aquatica leii]